MTDWTLFLIDHYTDRLQKEIRLEAKKFLRETLTNLKNVEPTDNSYCCVCHLASSFLHQQTEFFNEKI